MERLGRFKLHRRLAVGGMAEVFLTTSDDGTPLPGRMVLKRLLPEMESMPRMVQLFLNEGELGGQLHHPNIMEVLEVGHVEKRHYIVMELVDGPDVQVLTQAAARAGRRLGIPLAGHIVVQALRALDHAHFAVRPDGVPLGLIHRDVTPDNLFCRRTGRVMLGDFGIAKMSALEFFTDPRAGVLGKLPFMSPERVRGEPLDGRSDEFSAALVLYELCTGVRAYASRPGGSFTELRDRVSARRLAKPRSVMPDMSRRLESVIMRALEAEARRRFPTCGEFAAALEEVLRKEAALAGPEQLAALIAELTPG